MTPLHANPSPTARRTGAGRLLAALAFFLATGLAVPPAAAQDEPVTLNFTNADIEAVVKAVAEITGKSFIVDPRVKGTVTIVSARPVPRSLVYPTLLSALRTQGVTAVESDNGFGLTSREVEVLRLVADGRSNGQIAEQLFISRKTASVHVSNILGKLGVATRVEAAALAHRRGLTS